MKGIKTTIIGVIAIAGLAYNAYLSGGFTAQDFIILVTSLGLLAAKDINGTHTK